MNDDIWDVFNEGYIAFTHGAEFDPRANVFWRDGWRMAKLDFEECPERFMGPPKTMSPSFWAPDGGLGTRY